jgi:hypothetical protein
VKGLTFKAAKGNFFDRAKILKALDRATARVLSKFGSFVWKRARTSIRKRKGTSPPAGPPYSHTGALRKGILFGYDRDKKSVVIGPVLSDKPTGAPENLEYGGSFDGRGRVISISKGVGRDAAGRFTSKGRNRVTLSGKIRVRARPFMHPALDAERPKLAPLWRNSVR